MTATAPSTAPPRLERPLLVLLAVAFTVSVVHYGDNAINYDDFPADGALPDPPRWLVTSSWFAFTAAAVGAVVMLARGRVLAGAILLAVYSGSGLVGIGHYPVQGALGIHSRRHLSGAGDIACGLAIAG